MAYILTPRFTTAYQAPQCDPFGLCAPSSRPTYSYRTVQCSQPQPQPHPQPRSSPFASFFSQLDELLSEIDRESQRQAQIEARAEALRVAQIEAQREAYRQRQAQIAAHIEAQREAHRQRQLRKRAVMAKFAVTQNEQGWQIDAEIPGFEQENINIEVTDENTLKITGNTEWSVKSQTEAQSEAKITPAIEQSAEETTGETTGQIIEQTTEQTEDEKTDATALHEAEVEPTIATDPATKFAQETESSRPATPDSDIASHKSYQPTVEDDFEDLGPEALTLFSTPSQSTTPAEPKGKEKAVEPPFEHHENVEDPEVSIPETAVAQLPQPQSPTQEQRQEERSHSSFERTYRFPERIDASNVRAILKNGMLSISIPRAQIQQVRRIAIL